MRKIVLCILTVVLAFSLYGCGDDTVKNREGTIYGTWYSSQYGSMVIYKFKENGTYVFYEEESPSDTFVPFAFDAEKKLITFSDLTEDHYTAELKEDVFVICDTDYNETYLLYRDRDVALKSDPYYFSSDEFLSSIQDSDGWCIQDGMLYAYKGKEKKVTVPDNVHTIYQSAFSSDSGNGENLTEVIVPGSVREISDGAFSFTAADVIRMEEGVEVIGNNVFSDAYMDEIYFPASVKQIGAGIMETEEGLDGTRIHVPKDSAICEYFKGSMPYGDAKLVEE